MKSLMPFLMTYSALLLLLIFPKNMVNSLRCYNCIFNAHNQTAGCEVLNPSVIKPKQCFPTQRFCKVERYIVHSELAKFYRGCEEKCMPECKIIPGDEKCVSCCQDDLCNTGSRGHHQQPLELFNLLSLLPVAIISNLIGV